MKARNLSELKQLIQGRETKKELKTLCLLQLKKNRLPYSCYDWLKKKPRFKSKKNLLKYFNERCLESSLHLKSFKNINEILEKKSLSPFCHKKALHQKKRMEYKLRDRPASDIFKWYFTEEP